MPSRAARDAMNRAGPIHIRDLTPTATAIKSSVSAYMGSTLSFTARTATVHVNFGETEASTGSATTSMYAIAAGSTEEFRITTYRKWVSAIAGSTATLGVGKTSLGKP